MSDPAELPGLAHFCEHMLFLGTEKYPSENSFTQVGARFNFDRYISTENIIKFMSEGDYCVNWFLFLISGLLLINIIFSLMLSTHMHL